VIPYFELESISLGGGYSIAGFGTLVVIGVAVGVWFVNRRARAVGIPEQEISGAILWTICGGFVIGHVAVIVFYNPASLQEDGWLTLFQFWNGLSSFGGFFGAALGGGFYLWRLGKPWIVHSDIMTQGLVVGWVFGRLGCTVVHDHIGRLSDFPLAVQFPGGARHDLGLYELIYTLIVLVPAVFLINRKPRRPGTSVIVISLLYAPARFLADFLRNTDLPGADLRYAGLTPAQYGCFALLLTCVFIWMRSKNSAARGC